MIKEAVISIIIVVTIFGLEMFTQNFTKETVSEITATIEVLKEDIIKEDENKIKETVERLRSEWEGKYDKLAYYLEHDELEKVDTAIVRMKSYIETKNFSEAVAELEDGKFVLEHIKDKNAFNLQNIF